MTEQEGTEVCASSAKPHAVHDGITDGTLHDRTYRVILRIVKAGCHPVAMAQVVEH